MMQMPRDGLDPPSLVGQFAHRVVARLPPIPPRCFSRWARVARFGSPPFGSVSDPTTVVEDFSATNRSTAVAASRKRACLRTRTGSSASLTFTRIWYLSATWIASGAPCRAPSGYTPAR
jgi:hypothetical protein